MRCFQLIAVVILVATCLVSSPITTSADDSSFRLWPFQDDRGTAELADDVVTDGEQSWLWRSPLANVSWPEIKLPSIQILPRFSHDQRRRILGQNGPTLRERMSAARQDIAQGARQAWNRSLEVLKFRRRDNRLAASRQPRQPLFGRIFGSRKADHEGPRTVGEWLEQDRLEP